jgi:hypothetical protein
MTKQDNQFDIYVQKYFNLIDNFIDTIRLILRKLTSIANLIFSQPTSASAWMTSIMATHPDSYPINSQALMCSLEKLYLPQASLQTHGS